MILTDREIQLSLERKAIIIDPAPADKAFSSTSVDLTLDPTLSVFRDNRAGLDRLIDPSHKDFDHDATLADLTDSVSIGTDGYVFRPGYLILAWTKEYVNLKNDVRIAARVEGKSSLARLGIGVHVTAPIIHAGFDGRIRLEMINHGKVPVILREDMRICQLIFKTTLGTPDRGYNGRFAGQNTARRG
ncbi:dCTP deaminase [Methylobacterium sp. Leaf89]|uniref:dCTP deaminase n=1 Tax=Methylobacterium sp. Leaf89 TaxID=1736245 RepID=UPI0009EC5FA8|nr:dCTP deaminase [Methylobacterium sp. Leaf89]